MPVGVIVMCCMSGCGLMPLSGMVEMSSFCVNTDWKCWLSMLALVRLSDLMNPSSLIQHYRAVWSIHN